MSRDLFVFIAVILMVGCYGFYTLGYEKGEEYGRKQCPPVSQKLHLSTTTESIDGIRCQYENPSKRRKS